MNFGKNKKIIGFLNAIISSFVVTFLLNLLGFIRQILIALYFGISRELDIYFMVYTIGGVVVFVFAMIFDTVGIPHLVKTYEEEGEESFKRLTGSIFTFSLFLSFFLSLIFIIFLPILAKVMAAGFSVEDKNRLRIMGFYFLPWFLVSIPYYSLSSFYKSIRHFNIVFLGEIVISATSLTLLLIYHSTLKLLPVTYFGGYFLGFLILFISSFKYFNRKGEIFNEKTKRIYRNFFKLFCVNQIGSLVSITERFFQSFLIHGSISALSYASQLCTYLSSFLAFKEIFIVPLSSGGRKEKIDKLERLVIGLMVLVIPIMVFVLYYCKDIVTFLFKRGKFDLVAVEMTSSALSIYILSIFPATVGLPGFRMFQIIDKIKNTGFVYLLGTINLAIFGSLFVFYLKLEIIGMALATVINSYLSCFFTFYLLHRNGIILNIIRIIKHLSFSILISVVAITFLNFLPTSNIPLLLNFTIKGVVYIIFIILAYIPLKKRLMRIIK